MHNLAQGKGTSVIDQPGDVVEIKIPANPTYVSMLRTATAALAARADFTLDEIDDLRIAVDEACALLLPDARPSSDLTCRFTITPDALGITVSVPTRSAATPERTSFAWMVLTALAGNVEVQTNAHEVTIGLQKARSATR